LIGIAKFSKVKILVEQKFLAVIGARTPGILICFFCGMRERVEGDIRHGNRPDCAGPAEIKKKHVPHKQHMFFIVHIYDVE
jgi:hypothetical protein